jgi:hypothetical protein
MLSIEAARKPEVGPLFSALALLAAFATEAETRKVRGLMGGVVIFFKFSTADYGYAFTARSIKLNFLKLYLLFDLIFIGFCVTTVTISI